MAWRRPQERPRIEPPLWYRVYDPESWDGVCGRAWPGAPDWPAAGSYSRHDCWPQFLHDQHALRRWGQAQYEYRQAHPDLAGQELAEIRAAYAQRRAAR